MKLLNYLDFISEGLIKTHPYNIVLNKVDFLPNNLIYNIKHTKYDNLIHFEILYFNKLSDISNTFVYKYLDDKNTIKFFIFLIYKR